MHPVIDVKKLKFCLSSYMTKIILNAWQHFLDENKSINAPYHGYDHMVFVFTEVANYWLPKILAEGVKSDKYPILRTEAFASLLAAIFHDFNHSGGVMRDEDNVMAAVDAFELWISQVDWKHLKPAKSTVISLTRQAIWCTMYDGTKFPQTPQSEVDKILRDADLNLFFHMKTPVGRRLFRGLWSELLLSRPDQTKFDFVNKQVEFQNAQQGRMNTIMYLGREMASMNDYLDAFLPDASLDSPWLFKLKQYRKLSI